VDTEDVTPENSQLVERTRHPREAYGTGLDEKINLLNGTLSGDSVDVCGVSVGGTSFMIMHIPAHRDHTFHANVNTDSGGT